MAAGHRACRWLCRWIFSVHDSVLPHGLGAHEPLKHQLNDRMHAACLIHVTKVTDLTSESLLPYRRVLHRSNWFHRLCCSSKLQWTVKEYIRSAMHDLCLLSSDQTLQIRCRKFWMCFSECRRYAFELESIGLCHDLSARKCI